MTFSGQRTTSMLTRISGPFISVDSSGAAYLTGDTNSSDYPTTSGAFDEVGSGGQDAFVTKLNSAGSALVYSTYLHGNSFDIGLAIGVDASGAAHVAGLTWSSDFPTSADALDSTLGGSTDAFIAKLNAGGSALIYAKDVSSGIYVTGITNSSDFPTTPGSFDTVCGTDGTCNSPFDDVFVVRLDLVATTTTTTLPPTDLLPGRITVVKPNQLAKFVAKPVTGDTFSLPSSDPLIAGGSLRIFDTSATAGDDTYNLPDTGWQGLGNPPGTKGYRYKGAGTVSDPCKVALVKEKVIKGVCTGTGVTLAPPFTGDVGIILSLGTTDRYCAQFGGVGVKNDATLTKRKNAPAPGTCPP